MAGTLKTTFFNLVKYAANDITSWLTDFNGNMDKIDTAMNQNKTAAQTAQDGVDNLEAEYESLLSVVNGHTTSIDANEKAIAANTASITELRNELNDVAVYDNVAFKKGSEGATIIDDAISSFYINGRRIGKDFSGAFSASYIEGELHLYDRQANVPLTDNAYITDLVRFTGNPFNLIANRWNILNGVFSDRPSSSIGTVVIAYLADSNYTVVGITSSSATQVNLVTSGAVYVS